MPIRLTVQELQESLSRTQARIKQLEVKARDYLITHDDDRHGELENMWAELEFLQAKEEALLTQITLQSDPSEDLDDLFDEIQKELRSDT